MSSFDPSSTPNAASPIRGTRNFGRRSEPASIAITRNGQTTEYSISPATAAIAFSVLAMFAVGYFTATAYLVLRDDLIGMTKARNARLLHEYEDRIATLRANLDRVTSRQLLDQQAIEAKVAELIHRQEMLGGRSSRIGKLIDEADRRGLVPAETVPEAADPLRTGSIAQPEQHAGMFQLRGAAAAPFAPAPAGTMTPDLNDVAQTETMFTSVDDRIAAVDEAQRGVLDGLRKRAQEKTVRIATALGSLGVRFEKDAVGGPFIPLQPGSSFDDHVEALDDSLKALDSVSARLRKTPVANPVPGAALSSPFGTRSDPFLGRPALHAGLDFRAASGTPVRATADGKVVDAGRNGGYGIMVEIDHGGGYRTRYAHLSSMSVKTGDTVKRGQVVGKVGSTGRSTGPHLHYEVRRNGDATNPANFLKAGKALSRDL